MTKEDVAQYLRCTKRTVEKLMKDGKVPYFKIGKLVRFDFDRVKEALVK